jgi:hypothetical protein
LLFRQPGEGDAQPHRLDAASQGQWRPLYALEITAKNIEQIEAAQSEIPAGTPINIAFLGNETHQQRIRAAPCHSRLWFRAGSDHLVEAATLQRRSR